MKQFPFFATLAISLLLFLSCFKHDDDPELVVEINIQGTVKDADTGKPIADAEVTLSFEEKTLQKSKTNNKGAFSFPVSQDGNYQLSVQATGYRNAEKSFPLTNLSNNAMDIKLTLANSLTITNESSYDIENVKWSNGNASFGSIKIAGSVEVPVDTGSGYVFFTRASDRLNVHTEYVVVGQGERRKYIVADTTIVVEVGYGNNKKTLSEIKTENPNPSPSSSSSLTQSSNNSVVLPSSDSKQPSSNSQAPSSSSTPVVVPSSSSNSPAVPTSSSNSPAVPTSSSSSVPSSSSAGTSPSSNSLATCNGQTYNSATEFCYNNNQVVAKCEGKIFSTSQFCYEDKIYSRCGTADYNPSTSFCLGGAVKPKCNGSEYAATKFCFGSDLYDKCGGTSSGAEYDPTSEGCCGSNKYSLNINTQFCDSRDGKLYKAVGIGDQKWMAENLNYNASGSKCYSNSEANCTKYGRLYNWATAKSACPKDWHLPSDAEWNVLMKFVNPDCSDNSDCAGAGTKLKATSGWNTGSGYKAGEDNYGFSALPGSYDFSGGSCSYVGNCGLWWSATEYNADGAYLRYMDYDHKDVSRSNGGKSTLLSVRCLQD